MGLPEDIERRWDPYLLVQDPKFRNFFANHWGETGRRLLFIGGLGFDPRTCRGCEKLVQVRGTDGLDALLIDYDEGKTSPSTAHRERVDENDERFQELLDGAGSVSRETVKMWTGKFPSQRRVGTRKAQRVVPKIDRLLEYDEVVVDVSAMPKSIMFSILGKTIRQLGRPKGSPSGSPNLYGIVSEDPELDSKIEEVGPDDSATFIPGYGTSLEEEAIRDHPTVWIPVLGEGKADLLRRAHETVNPDEVLPVLPSPAKDPRRPDDLLREYHDLLFEEWLVEPTDFLYAAESNPFDLYRQILDAASHYRQALAPLGDCKFAITSASSKLLSIGTMLAALDLKANDFATGLAHVEVQGYRLPRKAEHDMGEGKGRIYCAGLTGEPYHD